MGAKLWLHKVVGDRNWLLVTDKGAELIETKAKLLERLKNLKVKVRHSRPRRAKPLKAKSARYSFKVKDNGTMLFSVSGASAETMWALYDLADTLHSKDGSLFTDVDISED